MSDISGEPVPATADARLSEDEHSELDRLRAEVASLRSQQATAARAAGSAGAPRSPRC